VNQVGELLALLGGDVARSIKPDEAHRPVVREQLADLRNHFLVVVALKILLGIVGEIPVVANSIGFVPVLRLRVIEAHFQTGALAGRGQIFDHIMMVRRRVDDIVFTRFGAVHGEAVMMLGSDGDVLHAGVLGDGHPLVGVEFYRVELRGELLVVTHRNGGAKHDPFTKPFNGRAVPLTGGHGVNAPVNKHSEARIVHHFRRSSAVGL